MLKKKTINIVFFVFFGLNHLFSQAIIRGPYLQQPTTSSIVVRWRTDLASDSKIIYGKSLNSLNQSASSDTLVADHILKVTGLEPDTKYFYEVWANNTVLSKSTNNFFITPPKSDSNRPIRIWAGGDFADFSNSIYQINQAQVRDSYLTYSKNFNTDLWLWLGDAGYGANRDVKLQESIFDFYGSQIMNHVPFAATLGNHEFDEDQINQQKTRDVHLLKITSPPTQGEGGGLPSKTKAYYSFNYGNTHFINLDSYGMDDGIYRLYDTQSAQYQWFVKDLEANKSLWTVVFFHHPPYTKRAHDSDTEEELRLLRQTLVPVFDKYKVDLVLNGHSHIYERSYLIQDHTGGSESFDSSYHIVNKNSGKYLKNEAPIINKTNGTMYVVCGTFGRLEPIIATRVNDPAHPSSYYANIITGGSLALKIEGNRLDLEWLCADGIVRDRFTLFKNVNKTTKVNLEYGANTVLKASWPGNYRWSNGINNKAEIEVSPRSSTNFFVKDSLGFLEDKFEVTVSAQPVILTELNKNQTFCAGSTVAGKFNLANTVINKWKYQLLLSDEKGSFEKPIINQEITQNTFEIKLPETMIEGSNYRFKVVPNSDLFEIQASGPITIYEPASGQFLNDALVPFSEEVTLNLSFNGSFPIDYKLSFQPMATTNLAKVDIKVMQFETKNYVLESVSNVCGLGKITHDKVMVTGPLGIEDKKNIFKLYPNPAENFLTIELFQNKGVLIIYNEFGQIVDNSINLKKGINNISLHKYQPSIYFVKLKIGKTIYTNKIIKE